MSDAESKVKAKLEWLRKLPLEGDGQIGLFARVHENDLNALLDIAEAAIDAHECMQGSWPVRPATTYLGRKIQALGGLPNE